MHEPGKDYANRSQTPQDTRADSTSVKSRVSKSMEIEKHELLPGAGGRDNGGVTAKGCGGFGGDGNALELDSCDGCTTL